MKITLFVPFVVAFNYIIFRRVNGKTAKLREREAKKEKEKKSAWTKRALKMKQQKSVCWKRKQWMRDSREFNDFCRDFIRASRCILGATEQFNVYLQIVRAHTHITSPSTDGLWLCLFACLARSLYITSFYLRRFGCFILNCKMIYYICTFIATTLSMCCPIPLSFGRARHYTHILLRHLSNVSTCHLFSFCAFFFLLLLFIRFLGSFFLFCIFLSEKQSRYVCVRWLLDMQTQFIQNCLHYEWVLSEWGKPEQLHSLSTIKTPQSATHTAAAASESVSRRTEFTACVIHSLPLSLRQFIGLRDAFAWITWMNKILR